MKKFAVLAISVLAISATAAKADEYIFATAEVNVETVVFINVTSIKSADGKNYTAWIFSIYNGSRMKQYKYVTRLQKFDCENDQLQTMAAVGYDVRGNEIEKIEETQPLSYIVPQSPNQDIANIVCAGSDRTTKGQFAFDDVPVSVADTLYQKFLAGELKN